MKLSFSRTPPPVSNMEGCRRQVRSTERNERARNTATPSGVDTWGNGQKNQGLFICTVIQIQSCNIRIGIFQSRHQVLEVCPYCPSRQTVTSVSTRDARLMKILENGFTKDLRRIDFISAKSCTPHILQHKLIVCLLVFKHWWS